jgi:hypothetical protein
VLISLIYIVGYVVYFSCCHVSLFLLVSHLVWKLKSFFVKLYVFSISDVVCIQSCWPSSSPERTLSAHVPAGVGDQQGLCTRQSAHDIIQHHRVSRTCVARLTNTSILVAASGMHCTRQCVVRTSPQKSCRHPVFSSIST